MASLHPEAARLCCRQAVEEISGSLRSPTAELGASLGGTTDHIPSHSLGTFQSHSAPGLDSHLSTVMPDPQQDQKYQTIGAVRAEERVSISFR